MFAGDFGEDSCAGPDADAGHRGQDLVKRVGLHQSLDLTGDLVALPAQRQELLREFRQHNPGRTGAHDHDRLLTEGGEHGLRETICSSWRMLLHPCFDVSAASGVQRSGSRLSGEQVSDGRMVQVRAQRPLQGGMDLREQPADPVRRCGDLAREVIIEPPEHPELGQGFIIQLH